MNKQIKCIGFLLVILFNLSTSCIFVFGLDNKVSNDSVNDIYQFDIEYIEEVSDDIIDGNRIERTEINEVYNELNENKEKYGKQRNKPNEIDINAIYFSPKHHNFTIELSQHDIELNEYQMIVGYFWNNDDIIMFVVYETTVYYQNLDKHDTHDFEIDDNLMTFSDDIPRDFDDTNYIKVIMVYFDSETNDEICFIDFYDSRNIDENYLFWIFILIAIIVLVSIILLIKYIKKRG